VKIGVVGLNNRGSSLLGQFLEMDDVAVPAVCDIREDPRTDARSAVADADRPEPTAYADYASMLAEESLDGVVIATPWRHHIPMAIAAMEAGVTPGMEVGPANSVEECRDLVRTAEETGQHCMLLENCCYYRDCMAVLNMVRQGVFGELVHCQCGYGHDLRGGLVGRSEAGLDVADGRNERSRQHEKRNGDLYPTHGVGPVAKCLEVNRGNRFVSLTATASKARGLAERAAEDHPDGDPIRDVDWAHGDVVTTTLRCANGETVTITHDVSLPRPYSNMYQVQGTGGLWQRDTHPIRTEPAPWDIDERLGRVHLEDRSPEHAWEPLEEYVEEYEHPRWAAYREAGERGGHGGIDYLALRDYVGAVGRDERPPIDVYDAAAWTAIGPLSEQSVAQGGEPVAFPDFTDGDWMVDEPIFGLAGEK